MEMTDREILARYKKAEGKREQNRTVRILAELNGVHVDTMRERIMELLAKENPLDVRWIKDGAIVRTMDFVNSLVDEKKEEKKKAAGVSDYVVEVVQLRLEEVGNMIEKCKCEIADLEENMGEYLIEWGELTEFIKANE